MRPTWRLGALAGATILLVTGVAVAAKPRSGRWAGTTSQSLPTGPLTVTFRVSSRGTRIVNFEPEFQGRCLKPGSPPTASPVIRTDAGRDIAIGHGGFHASGSDGRIHSGSVTLATASDHVRGRFVSRRMARGTYSLTFTFNSHAAPYGLAGYTCRTGSVSWTATAA